MFSFPSPLAVMSGPLAAPLLSLLSPPPHDATTSASPTTAITTEAASSALRLIVAPLFIQTPLLCCADYTGVVTSPGERDLLSPKRLCVLEARARVLPNDHELPAAVERHDEARDRPRVQAVADGSRSATELAVPVL